MLMTADNVCAGLNVLVVEDETLVLFNLEDMLAELGCVVIGPAMRLKQAEALVGAAADADAAILDVNLGGEPIFPVAEALAAAGVPIVFATGYGRAGLPPQWQDRPVLLKPYTMADVEHALAAIARQRI